MPQHRFTRERFEQTASYRDDTIGLRCAGFSSAYCVECTRLLLHVGRELWDYFGIENFDNSRYHVRGDVPNAPFTGTINLFTLSPLWQSPGGRYYLTCNQCTVDPTVVIETPRRGVIQPNRLVAVNTDDLLILAEGETLRWARVGGSDDHIIDSRCIWCHVNLFHQVPTLNEYREWYHRGETGYDEEEESEPLDNLLTDRDTLRRCLEQERRRLC